MKPTPAHKLITHDQLLDLLWYDPETGEFHWHNRGLGRRKHGRAGSHNRGAYWLLHLEGRRYMAHRVAWFYITGTWPDQDIDHANGNKSDNRFGNLRSATRTENSANSRCRNSKSGIKGVHWNTSKRKWRAQIGYNGRSVWLGAFDDKEDARLAYNNAAKALFGPFARIT